MSSIAEPVPTRSIATRLIFALVSVITVVWAGAGLIAQRSYRDDQLQQLHVRHALLADQLAIGLASPLWNFDRATLRPIADGALRHHAVVAVAVVLADDGTTLYEKLRGARWQGNLGVTRENSLLQQRPIEFEGETIGTVKVWATTHFVESNATTATVALVLKILAFDAALILCLYALLRWIVLRPLAAVERYALAVSSDPLGAPPAGPMPGLRGELASLHHSLVRMIERLQQLNASLEQRVAERTTQLALSNQELQAFSYSVSHDLRAPLRGIDAWSQALLEDSGARLDAHGREQLARVRGETQRMNQLIDDMLRLAKVTQSEMNVEAVDISALARAIVTRLQEEAPERRVDCAIEPGLMVRGDASLLQGALTNLLDNAWKFTSKRDHARIEVGQTRKDGAQVLFVRDNGAGFDMAHASKLFAPFQRMHRAAEFPGTGVGLATVQRIVHRHGGQIWVESEVDRGTTFFLTLEAAN